MDPLTLTIVGGLIATIGAAAAIAAARRLPSIMKGMKRYFLGLEFLVIGHKRAGKTSFYNYLMYDRLAEEYPTRPTHRVSKPFSFEANKGGTLQLSVQKAFDIPGELEPPKQITLARERTPDVLLIFLSAAEDRGIEWLDVALVELATALAVDYRLARKLKALTIIMNKVDTCDDSHLQRLVSDARAVVDNRLKDVLKRNIRHVDVLPCTLLRAKGGEKAANEIILSIIESLHNNRGLVPK